MTIKSFLLCVFSLYLFINLVIGGKKPQTLEFAMDGDAIIGVQVRGGGITTFKEEDGSTTYYICGKTLKGIISQYYKVEALHESTR